MRLPVVIACLTLWAFGGIGAGSAPAQQVHLSAPFHSVNESFYENYGIGFGGYFGRPNGGFFFNNGGPNNALPPFGRPDPGAGANFGFGVRGNGFGFNLRGVAAQGSNRSIVSQTPSLTVANGAGGFFSNSTVRPFVSGIIPVVGDRVTSPVELAVERLRNEGRSLASLAEASESPAGDHELEPIGPSSSPSPTADSRRSSAARGDLSVSEIRRQREAAERAEQAALRDEVQRLVARGEAAEGAGRRAAAKIYYQQAARRAEGAEKQALEERIRVLARQPR